MEPELPDLPKPFCIVRLDRIGGAVDVAACEQDAEMWVHGSESVHTDEAIRSYGLQCYRMGVERAKMYRLERDAARVQRDHVLKVLTGIHALLPPGPIAVDGKTYIFNDPDANRTLRTLKERIDAIEADAAAAIRGTDPT